MRIQLVRYFTDRAAPSREYLSQAVQVPHRLSHRLDNAEYKQVLRRSCPSGPVDDEEQFFEI